MNNQIIETAFVNDKDFDIRQYNKATYEAESFGRMLELKAKLCSPKADHFHQNGSDVTSEYLAGKLTISERFFPVIKINVINNKLI